MKKKLIIETLIILNILLLIQLSVVNAAPVYIDTLSDFPSYPYNSVAYWDSVDGYTGCGPTTAAMILGYFEHHFGATGLLDNPVSGIDEGLDTAWELHNNYLNTGTDGFGSPADIKPGIEDYAEDRGYEIKVMVHYSVGTNPADVPATYGAYGDGWTDDADFWIDLGGDVWDIDPDKFCDFVSSKLTAGIAVWLSVDEGSGGANHWVPCVGCDKDADNYYFYNTWDSSIHSEPIDSTDIPGHGLWAIGFIRTLTYIGPIEDHDVVAVSQTVADNEVLPGDVVDIEVTVRNDGDVSETFDLTCYYDSLEIGTVLVVDLAPGESRVVTFTWDTTGVELNEYEIKAWADSGEAIVEVDENNNWCNMPLPVFVVPEIPAGTIAATASMILALIGYAGYKRHKTK